MIRKPYEPTERRQLDLPGVTMTQQHMKDETDINNILKRYAQSGLVSHLAKRPGAYMDLPSAMEFQDAVALVMQAQEDFQALPSALRAEFDNDPAEFLAFVGDPANRDRMVELGLIARAEPEPAPLRVEVVNPASPED